MPPTKAVCIAQTCLRVPRRRSGAWEVRSSPARERRIADAGFTRYRPTNGGSTIKTPLDDALVEPDERTII